MNEAVLNGTIRDFCSCIIAIKLGAWLINFFITLIWKIRILPYIISLFSLESNILILVRLVQTIISKHFLWNSNFEQYFSPAKLFRKEWFMGVLIHSLFHHFVSERKMTNRFSRLHQWLRNLVCQIVYFRKLMNYKVSWMNMFRKVRVDLKYGLFLFWSKRKNCFVTFYRSSYFQPHRLVVDTLSFNKVKLYKCLTKWFFQLFSRLIN